MYLIRRARNYYFNRRIAGRILRISLRTQDRKVALPRAARLLLAISNNRNQAMHYDEIKARAHQLAEQMHNEWLYEQFNVAPDDESIALGYEVSEDRTKEALISGNVTPDELQDTLADLLFFALRKRTLDEWRDPELLLERSTTAASNHNSSTRKRTSKAKPPLISSLVDTYIAEKKSQRNSIKESTLDAIRNALTLFIEIIGDVPVDEVSYQEGALFRDTCLKLPTHRAHKAEFRDKSIPELLALNIGPELCMQDKTIKDNLSYVKGMFTWLARSGQIESSPIDGVSITAESTHYAAYTDDDLSVIFSSQLYSQDPIYIRRYGKRSNWWLLAIAIFTGARISEICQLSTSDIKTEGSIYYFSMLNEDENPEKSFKTNAARRTVPIHNSLIQMGFLEYLSSLNPNSDSLLPGIRLGTKKPGSKASTWFNERYRMTNFPHMKKKKGTSLFQTHLHSKRASGRCRANKASTNSGTRTISRINQYIRRKGLLH